MITPDPLLRKNLEEVRFLVSDHGLNYYVSSCTICWFLTLPKIRNKLSLDILYFIVVPYGNDPFRLHCLHYHRLL